MNPPPPVPSPSRPISITFKMFAVGGLVVLLMIPLLMVGGVIRERQNLRLEAIADITGTWGQSQEIVGPVLSVPYRYRFKTIREERVGGAVERREIEETAVATAHFLPHALALGAELAPDIRRRGIYEAVVYRADLAVQGSFAETAFDDLRIAPDDVLWEDATVSIAIPDLRGVRTSLAITWAGRELPLVPGCTVPGFHSGVHASLRGTGWRGSETAFAASFAVNGSGAFMAAPLGMETTLRVASSWPDPSFQGAFLPTERTVTGDGFDAAWNVSYYGRSYPQQWATRGSTPFTEAAVRESLFGVNLLAVVDSYRLAERAVKYGVLFIALVFTSFFLFELLARLRVHPFQYVLIGVALALFFLLLLSLSEFLAFGVAYAAAAAACTILISAYTAAVLRGRSRSLAFSAGLAALYGFLFVILSLQDYALLVGTAGLFLALSLVMYATRRVDWYAPSPPAP